MARDSPLFGISDRYVCNYGSTLAAHISLTNTIQTSPILCDPESGDVSTCGGVNGLQLYRNTRFVDATLTSIILPDWKIIVDQLVFSTFLLTDVVWGRVD